MGSHPSAIPATLTSPAASAAAAAAATTAATVMGPGVAAAVKRMGQY